MIAVEFSSKRTSEGYLLVPPAYLDQIPEQDEVRVIVLVEESVSNEQYPLAQSESNGLQEESMHSLEKLVAKIASKPSDPATIHPASGLLGEHLLNLVAKPTSAFDWKQWEAEWDRHEAKQKMLARANQQRELRHS